MLRERANQQKREEYLATILWSIGRMVGGDNYPFPVYSEYMNPTPADVRTGEEIKNSLIEKLKEGGGSVGGDDSIYSLSQTWLGQN